MDLKKTKLQSLSENEIKQINGGGNGGWWWLAEQIIDNWSEIKDGFADGWNGHYNPPKK